MTESRRGLNLNLGELDQFLRYANLSVEDRLRLQGLSNQIHKDFQSIKSNQIGYRPKINVEEVRWAIARITYRDASNRMLDTGPSVTDSAAKLPAAAEFILFLMAPQRRIDVTNDMLDWYPHWVQEKGRFSANMLCWWRISVALFGGLLDMAGKIAEIVGKFRGAK